MTARAAGDLEQARGHLETAQEVDSSLPGVVTALVSVNESLRELAEIERRAHQLKQAASRSVETARPLFPIWL